MLTRKKINSIGFNGKNTIAAAEDIANNNKPNIVITLMIFM